jgi:lipid II:glycine glycyltransferase (peptidoglycan interpeptide bridge formation enzyme)
MLTGRRLVSLPFSDHCDLLAESPEQSERLLQEIERFVANNHRWRYVEVRPQAVSVDNVSSESSWQPTETFCFHELPLLNSLEQIFRRLHKTSMQQMILRAQREDVQYEDGRSEALLQKFYSLLVRTRRRQGLPPQPLSWFRNLASCLGQSFTIRIASKNLHPIAGIVTLQFKDTMTYKYGCSDERFNRLGGTPFLLWKAIGEAKALDMKRFDLGRTDANNQGLIMFKDRLGAIRSTMRYWRYSSRPAKTAAKRSWAAAFSKDLFSRMPDTALIAVGRLLYKEIG